MSGADALQPVVDDIGDHRFVLERDGGVAELVYRVNGKRLVLVHTWVPETLRHQQIGSQLVRAAIERAATEGLTVVPLCSYARKWLKAHPEATATVAIDWGT